MKFCKNIIINKMSTQKVSTNKAAERLALLSQNLNNSLSINNLSNDLTKSNYPAVEKPFRVCVIGSGNWGTTIAKLIAENTAARPKMFEHYVNMWVHEEKINGNNLSDIINSKHENVKYLPKIKLPRNLRAVPNILNAVSNADLIVFNLPHQFLPKVLQMLKGNISPYTRAISCLKGLEVNKSGVKLLSTYIEEELGITCGVLSGANLAVEIARGKWSETTIAYKKPNNFKGEGKDIDNHILQAVFHRPYFHVQCIDDVAGVSIAGALKNIVALAVGFVDGMNWGDNAKAAIMRVGLLEIVKFSQEFFPESKQETFTKESAGIADLITTCSGGRNLKVGRFMAETGASAEQAEKELLNGQSSQGIITAKEVHELLQQKNKLDEYPLFEATYQIIFGNENMENLPSLLERSH